MFNLFKKSFWVPYENSSVYPTVSVAKKSIESYCKEQNWICVFLSDEVVEIDGKLYNIYRGYENGSRGNYGIKCIEK